MSMFRRKSALLVMTLLVVLAAACSKDAPATPTPIPAPMAPIVIGVSISQSGTQAREGTAALRGYQLAIDMVNEAGGIKGRTLQLKTMDDASAAAKATENYTALIADPAVDLLLGPYGSGIGAAVVPLIETAQTPVLLGAVSDPAIWAGKSLKWSAQAINPSPTYLIGTLEMGAKNGAKTVALVYEDSAFPKAVAVGVRQHAQRLGLQVVLDQSYPSGQADWAQLAGRAKGADLFLGGARLLDSVELTKAAAAAGYRPMLMSWLIGPAGSDFPPAVGDLAQCVVSVTPWLEDSRTRGPVADNATFVDRFRKAYNEAPIYQAAAGFGVAEVLVAGLRATMSIEGWIDKAAVRDYIFNLDTQVVHGHFKVNATGADSGLQIGMAPIQVQWQRQPTGGFALKAVYPSDLAESQPCFNGN